jgi:hypothetical protein
MPLKLLCRTHIWQLKEILKMLHYRRSMSGRSLVLCDENEDKVERAINLIEAAVELLKEVF